MWEIEHNEEKQSYRLRKKVCQRFYSCRARIVFSSLKILFEIDILILCEWPIENKPKYAEREYNIDFT